MAMHDLALEPWSLCLEVNARRYEEGPGVKYRLGPGRPLNNCRWASLKSMLYLAITERKIMGFTFWIVALILVHVAFLFMVPWE